MYSSIVKGYAAKAVDQPLKRFSYTLPKLGENDIQVDITHCGLCHTDIHAINDLYGLTSYPFVPGHEIVGHVSQLGSAVTSVAVGDRVGLGWQGKSCGKCEYCLSGEEQLCRQIADCGTWDPYGGFSTSIVVDHRFAYHLPDQMPSEVAAVMMCAGISVYAPLQRYRAEGPQKLAILGLGGLGHLALQFAHALGYQVTAISTSPGKRDQALAFGADDFFATSDRATYLDHIFYYDLVLCTAPGKLPWNILLNIPKKRGRIVMVSFPEIEMNPTDLVAHDLSITGSFLGNRLTMREMLDFAQTHAIQPVVEMMPMHKVNQAILRMKQNKARYRIVLTNESIALQP